MSPERLRWKIEKIIAILDGESIDEDTTLNLLDDGVHHPGHWDYDWPKDGAGNDSTARITQSGAIVPTVTLIETMKRLERRLAKRARREHGLGGWFNNGR